MSWIIPTLAMLAVGFALAFAACEWFAAGRRTRRDDDPTAR